MTSIAAAKSTYLLHMAPPCLIFKITASKQIDSSHHQILLIASIKDPVDDSLKSLKELCDEIISG